MAESDRQTPPITRHPVDGWVEPAGNRCGRAELSLTPPRNGRLCARRRTPQEADDSDVVGAVLPVSELDPPDEASAAAPELVAAFVADVFALVPDESVDSALRESLR